MKKLHIFATATLLLSLLIGSSVQAAPAVVINMTTGMATEVVVDNTASSESWQDDIEREGALMADDLVTPLAPCAALDVNYNQQVWLEQGTMYYESAYGNGSGKRYLANNSHTGNLRVNGFALNHETTGQTLRQECYQPTAIPTEAIAPDYAAAQLANLWLCVYDAETSGIVGWVRSTDLHTTPPEERTTAIKEETTANAATVESGNSEENSDNSTPDTFGDYQLAFYTPWGTLPPSADDEIIIIFEGSISPIPVY